MRSTFACLLLLLPYISPEISFSTNTTITHPESGLFLDYMDPYIPSDTIIHNSAIFPMTNDMCHFLPLLAAEQILSCNVTPHRNKRILSTILSLGLGTASLGFSISNSLQILGLQKAHEKINRMKQRFNANF